MRSVYLFDDGLPLAPLTDLRPAFDIRTGALTTFERVELGWGRRIAGLIVPPELESITRERHPGVPVNHFDDDAQEAFLLNGRWVECMMSEELADLEPWSAIVTRDLGVLAACGPVRDFARLAREDSDGYRQIVHEPTRNGALSTRTLSRPWHVRSFRDQAIRCDLDLIIRRRGNGSDNPPPRNSAGHRTWVGPSAQVHRAAVLDDEQGDIVIDAHAVVRPGAIVVGPAYIGPHATVLERGTIRSSTAIGPWCKVSGEISGVIFQGYSNKAHDGFLGDSYIGEWVNLGAGTTNSNLLNTYGEIVARAAPGGRSEYTGEQFLGAIIGDHVKTAICTRIMTGAVIHTGAMLAQTAAISGCIAPFAWMTDDGVRQYRHDKFEEVVRTVMARRGLTPSPAYLQRLAQLLHAAARQRA
jgi:UDP-N-acetylglucosamine diphosphorylase / glucose-1-phosphate thymidylyltransferase / UDP-N-acetylgalactosamine diphosphorylase / glucosamine-1-phosphate N-acetyltransferase / galactosamine-1-phosphate N-acetyltransferase